VRRAWSHDGATFSCQADTLAAMTNLEGDAEWSLLSEALANGRPSATGFGEPTAARH
jgi:hypothetical protein